MMPRLVLGDAGEPSAAAVEAVRGQKKSEKLAGLEKHLLQERRRRDGLGTFRARRVAFRHLAL